MKKAQVLLILRRKNQGDGKAKLDLASEFCRDSQVVHLYMWREDGSISRRLGPRRGFSLGSKNGICVRSEILRIIIIFIEFVDPRVI